ncbi:hypothetical protein RFI_37752, partial [Reticulomyxa filosa]
LSQERERCKLKSQVDNEREQVSIFAKEREDSKVLRIVLYGPTGEGKSLLANRFIGDDSEEGEQGPFVPSDDVHSKTQDIKKELVPCSTRYKYPFTVIDQPGCFDSAGRDRYHINHLVQFLRGIEFIHAIVLVKSFASPRLSSIYQHMLQCLRLDATFGNMLSLLSQELTRFCLCINTLHNCVPLCFRYYISPNKRLHFLSFA